MAAVGESVESSTGEPVASDHFGPVLEWEVGGDDNAVAFVSGRDHFEEKFSAPDLLAGTQPNSSRIKRPSLPRKGRIR